MLIKYAYTEVEQNEAIALLATSLFARIPSPYATLEDAIATISEQMVSYPHVCRDAFIPKVYEQLSSRFRLNEQFLNRVSTVQSASKVEHLSIQYGKELVEHIQNNPGIYILSGPMASGKSQKVMLPLFEHFSALQLYPLLMSAKRSLAKIMISDARHYETVYEKLDGQYANITEFSQGVCGVVNTLLGLLFSLIREQSNILLIDEIEDVLSHCISNAIGDGSFEPKIEILEQLFLQIRRSHTVVLADAFISTETIDEIAKHSDKPIYICNGGDIPCSYPQVDLHPSEAEFFANLIADLKSGKRVLMFTDCANTPDKPQFDKYFSYCAQFCSSALQVDSNTIQLYDLNDLFSNKCNYQYIQFSPVVTSGISITDVLFDKVYVLSHQTTHPLQLLQTLFRYRKAKVIDVFISAGMAEQNEFKSPDQLLFAELSKSKFSEICGSQFDDIKRNPAVCALLNRKFNEQQLRRGYRRNVLQLMLLHGFQLNLLEKNHELAKAGKQMIADAKKITVSKALKSESNSSLTIDYAQLLRNEDPTLMKVSDYRLYLFLNKLLQRLAIDKSTFTGECNQAHFAHVLHWLQNESIEINGLSDPVKKILQDNGFHSSLNSKKAKSVIDNVLRHFLKLETTEANRGAAIDGKRLRVYKVIHIADHSPTN